MHARENQTETPTAELKFLSHLRRRQKMDVFFFQVPSATNPVVEWLNDIKRYLTELECNGSAEQRL